MNKSGFNLALMGVFALGLSGQVKAAIGVPLPPDMALTTFTVQIQDVNANTDGNPSSSMNTGAISAKLLQTFAASNGTITRTLSLVVPGNGSSVKSFFNPQPPLVNPPSFTIDLLSPNAFLPSNFNNDITLTNCILNPGQSSDDDKYPTTTLTFTYGSIQFSSNGGGSGQRL